MYLIQKNDRHLLRYIESDMPSKRIVKTLAQTFAKIWKVEDPQVSEIEVSRNLPKKVNQAKTVTHYFQTQNPFCMFMFSTTVPMYGFWIHHSLYSIIDNCSGRPDSPQIAAHPRQNTWNELLGQMGGTVV